ncbi:MAG: bacillolysin [Thermoanaerobaculia bacterium]|nr:bacillolysin [Thermoanaerobaculia bacterium]
MKKLLSAALLLTATLAFAKNPTETKIKIHDQDSNGNPTFVTGDMGKLGPGSADKAAKDFLKSQKDLLNLAGSEDFDLRGVEKDNLGQTHVKFQETLKGLPVFGAEYIVHSDASGNVVGMNGHLAKDDVKLPRNPSVDAVTATTRAAAQAGIANWHALGGSTLTYVINEKGNAFLAWMTRVEYVNAQGPQIDKIFSDASNNGDLILTAPENKYAKSRQTYTANNGTTLPGTLRRSEGSADIGDVALDAAHNYAGSVYDYYKNVHARDSYDNAGATIKSSAHYSSSYNNAFWNGSQMVYGDGDGSQFVALSRALDVDAHELTHAVTERTANLTYSNESGALNEATSDILGNSCEAYTLNGGTPNANTWKVGEDIYTPGTSGDALRYMNNPTADGSSKDYYPERYTGTADNGGVHSNSGIANLVYYLVTMGGSHPRGKTAVNVTALSATSSTSLNMAQKIWYRALTVYFTSSTNFQGARTATVQAATDLYGAAAAATVTSAWDCVAVPGGGGGGGGGVTTLTNNQTVTGLSGATGSFTNYKITVPAGQTQLKITMSGGTGDADLYVKLGAQPTSTVYDYRPYLTGNAESVSVTNPAAGDWYISLNGYAAYSGVSLNANYTGGGGGGQCTSYSGSLSGTGASQIQPNGTYYTTTVTGTHTGVLTGPAGADFDLYLQKWNGSAWANVASGTGSTANESVTYSNGASGYYQWKVLSYTGSGSYTLCIGHP